MNRKQFTELKQTFFKRKMNPSKLKCSFRVTESLDASEGVVIETESTLVPVCS